MRAPIRLCATSAAPSIDRQQRWLLAGASYTFEYFKRSAARDTMPKLAGTFVLCRILVQACVACHFSGMTAFGNYILSIACSCCSVLGIMICCQTWWSLTETKLLLILCGMQVGNQQHRDKELHSVWRPMEPDSSKS